MKLPFKLKYLPLFTLGAGLIGMLLRFWYLSCRDASGLLPSVHSGDVICYVVFACMLVFLFLCSRQAPNEARYSRLFPASLRNAIGCLIGSLTIGFTSLYDFIQAVTDDLPGTQLTLPALILGILAAICLLVLSLCRFKGSRPSAVLLLLPVVYLMFHAVMQARLWSKETQASVIFFPFMASIFLLLNAYFLAALTVRQKGVRAYVFFNQVTLLLCCISFSWESRLFYMGMAAWVGLDLCAFPKKAHRTEAEEEV